MVGLEHDDTFCFNVLRAQKTVPVVLDEVVLVGGPCAPGFVAQEMVLILATKVFRLRCCRVFAGPLQPCQFPWPIKVCHRSNLTLVKGGRTSCVVNDCPFLNDQVDHVFFYVRDLALVLVFRLHACRFGKHQLF